MPRNVTQQFLKPKGEMNKGLPVLYKACSPKNQVVDVLQTLQPNTYNPANTGVNYFFSIGQHNSFDSGFRLLINGQNPKMGDTFFAVGNEWADTSIIPSNWDYQYFLVFKVVGLLDPAFGPVFNQSVAQLPTNFTFDTGPGSRIFHGAKDSCSEGSIFYPFLPSSSAGVSNIFSTAPFSGPWPPSGSPWGSSLTSVFE